MRRLALIATTAFVVGVFPLSAQTGDDARALVRDITDAMVAGDPDAVARAAGPQVEVSVDGETSVYTKAQARYVAGAFLEQHPFRQARVREINVVGRQCTARSRLMGSDGSEAWDLFLRLRLTEKGWELKELRLTPTDSSSEPGS